MKTNNYKKFMVMLGISFLIMYSVMFLNVDKLDHIYLSTTRAYMSLLMVTPMALLMLALMPTMFKNKSIAVFALALTFLRLQTFISDEQYMKAMIPHHSSAILVSQEAKLKDPEVRKLAEGIIQSQEKEIAEMKGLLAKMRNKE